MSKNTRLITIDLECEDVIMQIRRRLSEHDVRTVRSFDLKSACASYPDMTCPHHGESHCDCQLVVLLAYGKSSIPASITIHSRKGLTEVDLVDSPNNRPQNDLDQLIRLTLETKEVGSVYQDKDASIVS